jgi:hypothetical protein
MATVASQNASGTGWKECTYVFNSPKYDFNFSFFFMGSLVAAPVMPFYQKEILQVVLLSANH